MIINHSIYEINSNSGGTKTATQKVIAITLLTTQYVSVAVLSHGRVIFAGPCSNIYIEVVLMFTIYTSFKGGLIAILLSLVSKKVTWPEINENKLLE